MNLAIRARQGYNIYMNFLRKINPLWPLRLGLGLMFLYSGSSLFYTPSLWYGFAPSWFTDFVTKIISIDLYLRIQGVGEFIIGLLLLSWFAGKLGLRIGAIAATVELGLILFLVGIDPITFRDIGLFGAAVAFLILALREGAGDKPSPQAHTEDKIASS